MVSFHSPNGDGNDSLYVTNTPSRPGRLSFKDNSLHHCSAPNSPTRDANEGKSSLKLPPRLQNDTELSSRSNSSRFRNSSVLKRSLSYLSFRNKEFDVDPFMAALDHVRDEDRKKEKEKEERIAHHKRSQSLSAIATSDSKWHSNDRETAEVDHQDTVRTPLNPIRQRHKKVKEILLGSNNRSVGGSRGSRSIVRPSCNGALKKFREMWKARFKSRKDSQRQLRSPNSFVCMGFVHRFIFE